MKTAAQIDELTGWLAATDLALLELQMPGGTVRLGRDPAAPDRVVRLDARRTDGLVVRAPSVGEFLHRHPLHREPLARRGDRVTQGQDLGLLRVGPLLLRVDAPCAGVIRAVLADHGAIVGYGGPLFELHRLNERTPWTST